MGIGKNIEAAMIAANKKAVDIAEFFDITESAVSQWFTKDKGPKSSRLPALADFLGTTLNKLMEGVTDEKARSEPPKTVVTREQYPVGVPDIPVWASAQAGNDGAMVLTNEPIEYIRRSERMLGVKNPFSFRVIGASMSPAVEHGDQVIIHPGLPPLPGREHVFLQYQEDGTILALVKRLMRSGGSVWKVRQFNPPKDFDLPKGIWSKAYVVVERRLG